MHVRSRLSTAVVVLLLTGLLSGCRTSNHLLFMTYTKMGLDISTVNGTPTQALFGYKRFEGAIVPVDPQSAFDPVRVLEVAQAKAAELEQEVKTTKDPAAKDAKEKEAKAAQETVTQIQTALEAWRTAQKEVAQKAAAATAASAKPTAGLSKEEQKEAVTDARKARAAAEKVEATDRRVLDAACNGNANPSEIMSVYAAIGARNGWLLGGLKINQAFATGEAAKKLAADSEAIQTVIKAK